MPKYLDGSFSTHRKKNLKYAFMLDGKRTYVYGSTKQECWDKRTSHINGTHKSRKEKKQKEPDYTVGSWLEYYYNTFLRENGGQERQALVDRHIALVKKGLPYLLNKVTSLQIQEFSKTLQAHPYKRWRIIGLLNSAFNKACAMGMRKDNPCVLVLNKKPTSVSHPVLQLAEQRKIDNSQNNDYCKFIAQLGCCTGMRIGEIFEAEFDFNNHIITVTNKDTATKKHKRQIPFLPNSFITKEKVAMINRIKKKSAIVAFIKWFKDLEVEASSHSFRVTFISLCNFISINPKQIQHWSGHSSVAMTMDTYAKLLRKDGTSFALEYLTLLKEHLSI